jgi:YD repeat-containing protein
MTLNRAGAVRAQWVTAALAALTLVSACSSALSGSGRVTSSTAPSSTHDFPTASASPPSAGPSTPPRSSPPVSSNAPPPSRADRELRLDAQTNGQPHVIVAVPGGFEAATYDQAGNIQFWHDPGATTTWRQVGQSSYPVLPAQFGPPDATVRGALLAGMTHATFIVHGQFTGDASGNAVAFTTGAKGWGAIKAESDGNIGPSGHPVGSDLIGLSFEFGFVDGHLQTEDCPTNRPQADCGRYPIRKLWTWTGHDFTLA